MVDAVAPSAGTGTPATTAAPIDWMRVYLGFGGMALGQFMALLDIQIVAGSLVQIQSGVGATSDEISWVQTIYLLAEVLVMPLTAYLTRMWGTRPLFFGATVLFMIASALTGLSTTIEMLIVMRALQGLAAGALIPPVFATAMTVFPMEKRAAANVVMGLVVTLAPTIGPTLGGHLTEQLSWRWLFYINVPVGAVVLFLVGRYGGFDKGDPRLTRGIDWMGVGLMAVCLLALQYVVEEGAGEGWFRDDTILWMTVLAAITGVAFVWRQITYWQPILSLRAMTDANFNLGLILSVLSSVGMFGSTFLMPLFLGQVRGFTAAQVGTTMLVTGVTMFLFAPLVTRVANRLGPRGSLIVGFSIVALGSNTGLSITEEWGFDQFFLMQVTRGVGSMLGYVAVQQITISSIPVSMMKDASALISLIRNLAGAISLALIATLLTRQTAVHYGDLATTFTVMNPSSAALMEELRGWTTAAGLADPDGTSRKVVSLMLHRKAQVMAYADAYFFLSASSWAAAAGGLLMWTARRRAPADVGTGH